MGKTKMQLSTQNFGRQCDLPKHLEQRILTCGPRTPGGPRLFRALNNFSQQINKAYIYIYVKKKQNLKLEILKRSVKVKEFEIGG
jgi:uncharacterized C2H2 Zn-finger protein